MRCVCVYLCSRRGFISADPHLLRATLNQLRSELYEQERRFDKLRADMGYPGALIDRIESGNLTDEELKIPGVADAFKTRCAIEVCLADIQSIKQALENSVSVHQ